MKELDNIKDSLLVQLLLGSKDSLIDEVRLFIKNIIKEEVTSITKSAPKNTENEIVFLTRKETAEFFQVSLVTIHQWTNDGLIKQYKIGNRTYYNKSELIEVLLNSNNH